jgi:hypothetical protein
LWGDAGLVRRHLLAEQIAPVPIHHTDDDEAYHGLLNKPEDRQPPLPAGHKAWHYGEVHTAAAALYFLADMEVAAHA